MAVRISSPLPRPGANLSFPSSPKFTITLLRTPKQPPNLATFAVPRRLNKLDLKDYLWHAYGVPVLRVRSRLRYEPPVFGRPGQQAPQMKRWRRRVPSKRMTVEMALGPKGGDFVWPEEIKDLSPYVLHDTVEPWSGVATGVRWGQQNELMRWPGGTRRRTTLC